MRWDGDTPLTGTVESFRRRASRIGVPPCLPFEPGSEGTSTKIVQRGPCGRIRRSTPGEAAVARLRPGFSVTAKVSLR